MYQNPNYNYMQSSYYNGCCPKYDYPQPDCYYPYIETSTIIPFATGLLPAILTTIADGTIDTVSLVGFGSSVTGITFSAGTIDFGLIPVNYSFSAPRSGVIKSIAATFSTTAELSLIGATVTIRAEIYRADANSNLFTPTGAYVELSPTLTGIINIGTISSGINSHVCVPISSGDRILMVFSASAVGINLITSIIGSAGAGISIC